MSTVKHFDSAPTLTTPPSPTYHCIVPSRTLSPSTKKALMTEEDEEEAEGQRMVDVYMPDTRMRYCCPRQHISHKGLGDKMVICRTYSNAIEVGQSPKEACAMGNQCRFVHINVPLSQLKGDIIHVHYIYRDASLCPYERLSTVMARDTNQKPLDDVTTIQVACPSGDECSTVSVPITEVICTEGAREALLGGKRAQPCHCAHYYYAQTCNRGASCAFIHVVSVDPSQERDSTRPATFRKRMRQLGLELSMNSFMFNNSPISSVLKPSTCTSPSTFSIHSMSTAAEKDINFCDVDSTPEDCFHFPFTRQNSCVSIGLSASLKSLPMPKSTSPCTYLPKDNEDSFITIRTTSTVIVPLVALQPTVPKGRFVHNPYEGSCMSVLEDCI